MSVVRRMHRDLATAEGAASWAVCVPALRLFTERLLVEGEDGEYEERVLPVLSLSFGYPDGGGPAPDAEARAARMLEAFGAVDLACVEHVVAELGSDAGWLVHGDQDPHALCSFTAHAVPRLRELGWRVELAPD